MTDESEEKIKIQEEIDKILQEDYKKFLEENRSNILIEKLIKNEIENSSIDELIKLIKEKEI